MVFQVSQSVSNEQALRRITNHPGDAHTRPLIEVDPLGAVHGRVSLPDRLQQSRWRRMYEERHDIDVAEVGVPYSPRGPRQGAGQCERDVG